MESSIATFLMRWSACELLPTNATVMALVLVQTKHSRQTTSARLRTARRPSEHQPRVAHSHLISYLLGLLAMIKCSICSYQCDN